LWSRGCKKEEDERGKQSREKEEMGAIGKRKRKDKR